MGIGKGKGWGGYRPGAGRKPFADKMVKLVLYLSESESDMAHFLADSEGKPISRYMGELITQTYYQRGKNRMFNDPSKSVGRKSEDIRVIKQDFKGKSYMSIRKWYQDNGEWKPGKQGINLKMEEWEEFLDKLEVIKAEMIKEKEANKD